ncbi:unnamed protein product [Cochlearia groenlandica]
MEEGSLTPSNPQSTEEKTTGVLLDPIGDSVESDCDPAVVEIDGKDSVEDSEGDGEDCEEEEDSEAEEDFEEEDDEEDSEEDDEEDSEEDSEGGEYFTEEEKEILRRRPKVKKASKTGFFEPYDDYPDYLFGGVCPITNLEEPNGRGINAREFCSKLTSLCLERYNHEEGLNVKFDHIVRVNFVAGPVAKFYITFAAKVSECSNTPLKDYQAKAAWSLSGKSYPMFCRPAPPPQNGILWSFFTLTYVVYIYES